MTSGVSKMVQKQLGEFLGVKKTDLPTLRIIEPKESVLKYRWDGDISALTSGDVKEFYQ